MELLQGLSGFKCEDWGIFAVPVDSIYRSVIFQGSSFSKEVFYVAYSSMPLYLPTDVQYLALGDRLLNSKGNEGWKLSDPSLVDELWKGIRQQALPFFAESDTPIKLAEALVNKPYFSRHRLHIQRNPLMAERFACSLIKGGNLDEGFEVIATLIPALDLADPIDSEVASRIDKLLMAKRSGEEAVKRLLSDWEQITRRSLKITEL